MFVQINILPYLTIMMIMGTLVIVFCLITIGNLKRQNKRRDDYYNKRISATETLITETLKNEFKTILEYLKK